MKNKRSLFLISFMCTLLLVHSSLRLPPLPGLPFPPPPNPTTNSSGFNSNLPARGQAGKLSFPAQEFFKIPDNITWLLNPIWKRYEFDNFVNRRTCLSKWRCPRKLCRCDDACMTDRTCCIDFMWNSYKVNISTSNTSSLNEYLTMFVQNAKSEEAEECRPVLQYTGGHLAERIKMIPSCPKFVSNAELSSCLAVGPSNSVNIPVIGSDGFVYKNQYCALCNRVATYKLLTISVKCGLAFNMTNPGTWFSNFKDCYFRPVVQEHMSKIIKSCKGVYNRNCSPSHPYYELCRSYAGKIGTYANVHCLWCNNESFDIVESHQCPHDRISPPDPRSYSFTISFTEGTHFFYSDGNKHYDSVGTAFTRNRMKKKCPDGETYELGQNICTKFQCAIGYLQDSYSSCRKKRTRHRNRHKSKTSPEDNCLLFSGRLLLDVGSRNVTKVLLNKLMYTIFDDMSISYHDLKFICIDKFPRILMLSAPLPSRVFQNLLPILSSTAHDIWKSVDRIYMTSRDDVPRFSSMYGADLSRHFGTGICLKRREIPATRMFYNKPCIAKTHDKYFYLDNVTLYFEVKPGLISEKWFLCEKFHLQSACKLKSVPLAAYSYSNSSSSITLITQENITLNYSDYLPLPDGVGICIKSGKQSRVFFPTWIQDTDIAEYYFSIIGVSISIICYLCIILTFTLIQKLRNISGCNIAALCVSLLLCDILFLSIVGSQGNDDGWCKVLSISFHWLLLHSQAWSGIIAVEVALRFVRGYEISDKWDRFRSYVLAALASPSIIVTMMVVLDETKGIVGYGKGGLCWTYDFKSRLLGYILPVTIVTLCSTVLLSYTLHSIHKQHRQTNKMLSKSGGHPFHISKAALKLVLLVGIAEIVGFVQITSPSSRSEHIINVSFRMLFTFLRSFRGLLIWCMYIANKRMWTHYRVCFGLGMAGNANHDNIKMLSISSSTILFDIQGISMSLAAKCKHAEQ